MENLNLDKKTKENIIKSSYTGDLEYIENWLKSLNNNNDNEKYIKRRRKIEEIIENKFKSNELLIENFNNNTNSKYECFLNFRFYIDADIKGMDDFDKSEDFYYKSFLEMISTVLHNYNNLPIDEKKNLQW